MRRVLMLAVVSLFVLAVVPNASAQLARAGVAAHGIVDWNSAQAFLLPGSTGISRVVRLADGQVEVGFSSPQYVSLQSTVIVSCRRSLPCFVTWDTFGSDSVRVRVWEANGTPAASGSFSVALLLGRNMVDDMTDAEAQER